MKEIFEQFQFIPQMFNTTNEKVQNCGIWGMLWSFILWFIDCMLHFTINIAGVSILYAVLIFFVMLADYISGIRASKKEWELQNPDIKFRAESKKGLRWAIKYITYITGVVVLTTMIKEVYSIDFGAIENIIDIDIKGLFVLTFSVIKIFLMLYILRWELTSIDENLERLGHDFKIFDFFSNALHAVTTLFKSKTGIDINDKDNGNNKTN